MIDPLEAASVLSQKRLCTTPWTIAEAPRSISNRKSYLILFLCIVLMTMSFVATPRANDLTKPTLGLSVTDMDANWAEKLVIKQQTGALVAGVIEGGPADQIGIEPFDVLVKMGDKTINNAAALLDALSRMPIGAPAAVTWVRLDREYTKEVTIAAANGVHSMQSQQSEMRGTVSQGGLVVFRVPLSTSAILRVLVLPITKQCGELKYNLSKEELVLDEGYFNKGFGLEPFDSSSLTLTELALPVGDYTVTITSESECRYAATVVIRSFPAVVPQLQLDAKFPALNLNKEVLLRKLVIDSGLYQFIDIGSIDVVLLDRIGDSPSRLASQLGLVCRNLQHGSSSWSGVFRYICTE
jgi:PDZ domain